jgi:hypothetical protein
MHQVVKIVGHVWEKPGLSNQEGNKNSKKMIKVKEKQEITLSGV